MTYARKKNMTIWMKNLGLSLKLGAATDLLLENTLNALTVSDKQGLWEEMYCSIILSFLPCDAL
jgi:hypothetical protein